MKYIIFDFSKNENLIDSFLNSASKAHNETKKSIEWFNWKFRDNPFGKSILACAIENNQIVGCVAYGIQPLLLNEKRIKGSFSFANFVHPSYQRKGIFRQLITLSEKEALKEGINILFVLPNIQSLPGYERMNWSKLAPPEYWIKGKNLMTIPLNIKEIRQKFKPNSSNIDLLIPPNKFKQKPLRFLTSDISLDFLKWRFFKYPVSEYVVIDNSNYYSLLRIGNRGKIKEAQVLCLNLKGNSEFKMQTFLSQCKKEAMYDIISFPISKSNFIRKKLKNSFFLKVPNQTNICYKILDNNEITDEDVLNISLSGINYHTY